MREELNALTAGMVVRTTVNNADDRACKQKKKTHLMLYITGVTEEKSS